MELRLKHCHPANTVENTEPLPFVKLHSTLCFLMTQYYQHKSPKLAQFIVNHIRLVIEHPDVDALEDCRSMYLQLLQQWQTITLNLLEPHNGVPKEAVLKH